MRDYIISKDTLIIIPIGHKKSRVVELDQEFIVNKSPYNIVKESCLFFGSSLEGRQEGTKYYMNFYYKVPILLSEMLGIIIIPTLSSKSEECCWIILNNIKEYYKENYTTNIVFDNNKIVNINNTISSFENQYFRGMHYRELLTKKQKS